MPTKLHNQSHLKATRRQLRHDQTGPEEVLWGYLRRKQIAGHKFYRQFSIGNYIVDFYSPSLRLVIEVDGETHLDMVQKESDRIRDEWFHQNQIQVLRFWNNEIFTNIEGVLESISSGVPPLYQRGG